MHIVRAFHGCRAFFHWSQHMLQAFHLSQGKKSITYIWADDSNQHPHDSATSNRAGPKAAPNMDESQTTAAMLAPLPSSRAISDHASPEAAPILNSDLPPDADTDQLEQIPAWHARHHSKTAFAHSSEIEQRSKQSERAPKAVKVELSIKALSSETVGRMLALTARTERRAESLIGKVQAIKTSCRAFLDSMPEHVCADA